MIKAVHLSCFKKEFHIDNDLKWFILEETDT